MPTVKQWFPFEITRTSKKKYRNPFTDLEVWATFVAPSKKTYRLPGFFDGEGRWKVRFSPPEPGTWTYTMESKDPAIAGPGQFSCTKSDDRGLLGVDPKFPRHFLWANGERFFSHGYTSYWLLGYGPGDQNTLLDYYAAGRFNCITFALAFNHTRPWQTGTPSLSFLPWVVDPETERINFRRFDLKQWAAVDRLMKQLRARKLVAQPHLLLENQPYMGAFSQTAGAESLYFTYAIARLAAFPNLRWNVMRRYQNFRRQSWAEATGTFFKKTDPYLHLVSVHETTLPERFWCDFASFDLRGRATRTSERLNNLYKASPNFPFVCNLGYEGPRSVAALRDHAWAVVAAGGYYSYGSRYTRVPPRREKTPRYLHGLYEFMTTQQIPYWRMVPRNDLVNRGFCLADAGRFYLIYLPGGGEFEINVAEAGKEIAFSWANPLTGEILGGRTDRWPRGAAGEAISFRAPTETTWLLLIRATRPPK